MHIHIYVYIYIYIHKYIYFGAAKEWLCRLSPRRSPRHGGFARIAHVKPFVSKTNSVPYILSTFEGFIIGFESNPLPSLCEAVCIENK